MKLPGLFSLTTREQRAVILILMTLLAVAILKRYQDRGMHAVPVPTALPGMSAIPSTAPLDEEDRDQDE